MNDSTSEFPIPIDGDFEDRLRQLQIPDSNLNSAQVMYDAGWAAAMASLGESSTAPVAIPEPEVELPARSVSAVSVWRWATAVSIATTFLFAGLYFLQSPSRLPPADQMVKQATVNADPEQRAKSEVSQPIASVPNDEGIRFEKLLEAWPDGVPLNSRILRGGTVAIPRLTETLPNRSESPVEPQEPQEVLRSGPNMHLLKKLGLLGSGR